MCEQDDELKNDCATAEPASVPSLEIFLDPEATDDDSLLPRQKNWAASLVNQGSVTVELLACENHGFIDTPSGGFEAWDKRQEVDCPLTLRAGEQVIIKPASRVASDLVVYFEGRFLADGRRFTFSASVNQDAPEYGSSVDLDTTGSKRFRFQVKCSA